LISTLEAVQQLMSAGANPDSPLNLEIAKLIRDGDMVGAEGLVRFYTQMYAVEK
jgi:peroxin-4